MIPVSGGPPGRGLAAPTSRWSRRITPALLCGRLCEREDRSPHTGTAVGGLLRIGCRQARARQCRRSLGSRGPPLSMLVGSVWRIRIGRFQIGKLCGCGLRCPVDAISDGRSVASIHPEREEPVHDIVVDAAAAASHMRAALLDWPSRFRETNLRPAYGREESTARKSAKIRSVRG